MSKVDCFSRKGFLTKKNNFPHIVWAKLAIDFNCLHTKTFVWFHHKIFSTGQNQRDGRQYGHVGPHLYVNLRY